MNAKNHRNSEIALHDELAFPSMGRSLSHRNRLYCRSIIRKRSGQGIVRENKSRALSITRYGATYQRSRWARGCAEWREWGSDKKSSAMWDSSLRPGRARARRYVQRRTLYLRAFKFWPIRIHFERGQAVIYACGACGSRPRRGEVTRGREEREERNGSSSVTKRGIEREIKGRQSEQERWKR